METCTIGISVNSSPNIIRKGMKTPWSSPGPENPRPSSPRGSWIDVTLAACPAFEHKYFHYMTLKVSSIPVYKDLLHAEQGDFPHAI